ncbi:Isoniazid-induced protein IniC [Pseudoclavibacter triregionum]|nr:Isoniazid-induced protein IniC [Pseudoclavibacter triregionum]
MSIDRGTHVAERMRGSLRLLCDEVDRAGGPPARPITMEIRRTLDETIRLAVVGRVKAGKSTLVNALIGKRVAPTSERECTKITTHYRFGSPERGELVLLDGRRIELPLDGGSLPEHLPVGVEAVSHAVISLQVDSLRDVTLIDTPGLATTTTENEETTRRALLGHSGARQADALLYVFHNVPYLDDVSFLQEWGAVTDKPGESAASAIGILSHADQVGGSPWGADDPIELARKQARDIAKLHGAQLGTVVPVAGRMAEAAETGLIRERDARSLASLAGVDDFDLELRDPEDKDARCGELSGAELANLVDLVGEYGLRYGRQAAGEGSRALSAWMRDRSGIEDVHRALRDRYVGRAQFVKVRAGLNQLDRLAWAWGAPPRLKELVAEARLREEFHPIRELDALERLSAVAPQHELVGLLDRQLSARDDADRLGVPAGSQEAVKRAALERVSQARRAMLVSSAPLIQHACRVLERSFTIIAKRASQA